MIRNQRGLITVDFLFSMTLVLGLSALMFVLCFTLSLASVTQYVTFASARNFFAAHITPDAQGARADQKYQELISHPVFKPLYSNGWFKVDAQPNIGDHTQIIPEFQEATGGTNKFWGVGTRFVAPVLAFEIPFFGSTVPDGDASGEGFATYLGSYLGREPSTEECLQFTAARWTAIRNLQVSGGAAYSTGTGASGYFPQTDDGC
jgi:hypothetical protein